MKTRVIRSTGSMVRTLDVGRWTLDVGHVFICAAMVVFLWGSAGLSHALEVTVSDALARPGESAVVSILVDEAAGIAGGDIELTYDPSLLTALGVQKTALTGDLLWVSNLNTSGLVRISFAGTVGMAGGSGSIADIRFVVNARAEGGQSSRLGLLRMDLRDEATELLSVARIEGVFTVRSAGRNPGARVSLDLDPSLGDQGVTAKGVSPGDIVDVSLYVRGVSHLGGYVAVVQFDAGVVGYVSGGIETAEEGNILKAGEALAMGFPPSVGDDGVALVSAILGPTLSTAPRGSGFLGVLRFRALEPLSRGEQTVFTCTAVLMGLNATELDTLAPGMARVTLGKRGDFDRSGRVGVEDFFLFASAFGTASGHPKFDSAFDLNGDGRVGIKDFLLFAAAFEGSRAKLAVLAREQGIPMGYELAQNVPNPFNAETVIGYTVLTPGEVVLDIYGTGGQRIRRLVQDDRAAGAHGVVWDGLDDRGEPVASGIYVYVLQAEGFSQVRKMTLIR